MRTVSPPLPTCTGKMQQYCRTGACPTVAPTCCAADDTAPPTADSVLDMRPWLQRPILPTAAAVQQHPSRHKACESQHQSSQTGVGCHQTPGAAQYHLQLLIGILPPSCTPRCVMQLVLPLHASNPFGHFQPSTLRGRTLQVSDPGGLQSRLVPHSAPPRLLRQLSCQGRLRSCMLHQILQTWWCEMTRHTGPALPLADPALILTRHPHPCMCSPAYHLASCVTTQRLLVRLLPACQPTACTHSCTPRCVEQLGGPSCQTLHRRQMHRAARHSTPAKAQPQGPRTQSLRHSHALLPRPRSMLLKGSADTGARGRPGADAANPCEWSFERATCS